MVETPIRARLETTEELILSPLATTARESRGRALAENPDQLRTCFMRDRDRIIHSKSFRRLKHKTQVYISPGNDHYRTRLTHTLEVAQIARTIGRGLQLNEDLIEAIALGHDVGHTPFAHTGEEVLNALVPGGFKHAANSVRVLTKIETKSASPENRGLNLTWEVLNGIANHSGFGDTADKASTLEGQVIQFSDKIAYVQHDIDDSIRAGIVTLEDLPSGALGVLGMTHGERIGTLVLDVIKTTRALMDAALNPDRPGVNREGIGITLSPEVDKALHTLRDYLFDRVYKGDLCNAERDRAVFVVETLYNHYIKDPELMPRFYRAIADTEGIERGVADYISGMTDVYCMAMFERYFVPKTLMPGRCPNP